MSSIDHKLFIALKLLNNNDNNNNIITSFRCNASSCFKMNFVQTVTNNNIIGIAKKSQNETIIFVFFTKRCSVQEKLLLTTFKQNALSSVVLILAWIYLTTALFTCAQNIAYFEESKHLR